MPVIRDWVREGGCEKDLAIPCPSTGLTVTSDQGVILNPQGGPDDLPLVAIDAAS